MVMMVLTLSMLPDDLAVARWGTTIIDPNVLAEATSCRNPVSHTTVGLETSRTRHNDDPIV
jgi:hypothetical protein